MASNKLFVGSLSYNTTSEGIRSLFEECGPVEEANVVTDRESGRSRGFAFVTFQNPDDATKAMNKLNGYNLDGREIRVNFPNAR